MGGKIGAPTYLQNWNFKPLVGDIDFSVEFDWNEDFGTPGAILVRNTHYGEFYLKTVTLEDVPGRGRITFICNSWVYNEEKYQADRVFFANKVLYNIADFSVCEFTGKLMIIIISKCLISVLCRHIFRVKCRRHFVCIGRKS